MAKRKHSDPVPPPTSEDVQQLTTALQESSTAAAEQPVDELEQEVAEFLARREELARKLADEIAATERRLADLRRTAALLFPESSPPPPAKERKAKKPAAKGPKQSAAPAGSPTSDVAEGTSDTEQAAPLSGAPHEPHLD
jgi:hypothetical protein